MTALVVAPSALVAITTREPGADALVDALDSAGTRWLSAPSMVELSLVLEGRAPTAVGVAARLVRDWLIDVEPFDQGHAERAVDAFRRFGKGRHPAGLNFGDCCTYALAEERGVPILCTGEDFLRTDLPVLPER